MNILILAAGEGRRFVDAGITTPKPFIEVNGKTLLEWTTRSIPFIGHYDEEGDHVEPNQLYFAIREDHDQRINASDTLMKIYGSEINIIRFQKTTRGNLETAAMVASLMELHDSLLILDCDNKYSDNDILDTFVEAMEFEDSMVVSYFDPLDESTKWAFVYSDGALVTSIVEKDPDAISKGGRPLIGTFWFSSTRLFMKISQFILKNNLKTGEKGKEEFYISQVPALHAANAGAVFVHKVDNMVPLGTPEDVMRFQQ